MTKDLIFWRLVPIERTHACQDYLVLSTKVIKLCVAANRPMSVEDVEDCIIAQRMHRDNLIPDESWLGLSKLPEYKKEYGSTHLYRDFVQWISEGQSSGQNFSATWWMSLRQELPQSRSVASQTM